MFAASKAGRIYDSLFFSDYGRHARAQVVELWGLRQTVKIREVKRHHPAQYQRQEKEVSQALKEERALVVVSSDGCPPCRALEAVLGPRLLTHEDVALKIFNINEEAYCYVDKILAERGIMPLMTYTPLCIAVRDKRIIGKYVGYDAETGRLYELLDGPEAYDDAHMKSLQRIIEEIEE